MCTKNYEERTKLNIKDSNGTLIVLRSEPIGGTLLTIEEVVKLKKPLMVYDMNKERRVNKVVVWFKENNILKINIAGPRESQTPGIYKDSFHLISEFTNNIIRSMI